MLKFQHVSKTFKSQEILHDISMEIHDGEFVVLIGPSSCGKTTSLKMINRLIAPSKGQILLNGNDIRNEDVIRLRRNMGYVIQQTGLFPRMNIEDNMEVIVKLEHVEQAQHRARTKELMEAAGLDYAELSQRYPQEFSGGQQQRVGVARAFALDPGIVPMDEPFSALGPITRSSLQDQLLQIQENMGKTIVFVTHDMDEVIKIVDRICIMHDGNIVQFDAPEEILKHPVDESVSSFVGKNRIQGPPELIRTSDIMIKCVITTYPGVSPVRAYEYMRYSKMDTLMVIDHSQMLQGMITAKMIRRRSRDDHLLVHDIMVNPTYCAQEDDNLVDAIQQTGQHDFYNVLILDEQGKLRGLITRSSLAIIFSKQFGLEEGEQARVNFLNTYNPSRDRFCR